MKIVEAATGVNLTASDELRNRQTAALAVLKHFASYTIQIIQNTVASDSYWLDWKTTRITNDRAKGKGLIQAQLPMYSVENQWSIKEGPIWLNAYSEKNMVTMKEKFSAHDKIDTTYSLQGFSVSSRERAKMPMFGIIDARIPDVVTVAKAKKYATYTTGLYPVATSEGFGVSSSIDNSFVIQPRQTELNDLLNVKSTINRTFTIVPQTDDALNNLTAVSSINTVFTIEGAKQYVRETLGSTASIESEIHFSTPLMTIGDGVDVSSQIHAQEISPPSSGGSDGALVTSAINNVFVLTTPTSQNDDVVNVQSNIGSTMSIGLTNTADIPDSTRMVVSATKLTIIKASPTDDELSVAVSVDEQMTIAASNINQPTDNTNVTVTAAKLSITKPPVPELKPDADSTSVTLSASKLTITKP